MITRIEIEGYKSIKKLDLPLSSINILLGSNGVGKSNLISIFALIREILNKNLQNYIEIKGGADSFLYFGKKVTSTISVDVHFGTLQETINRYHIQLEEAQDSLIIKNTETAFNSHGTWQKSTHEESKKESDFLQKNSGQAFWVNQRLQEFDVYHFHDTGDKSPMKSKAHIDDNRKLRSDGANIAAFLYYLKQKHSKHFYRIEKMVQSIAPFFSHFDLEPSMINEEIIQLKWKEKNFPESYFNAYHLSDGTLRFICLATLLMQPNLPSTIIIDEPELGLHPVAINKLAAMIRKAAETSQIIISTQSTNLIDNFNPEDIIVTDREQNSSVFKRLHSEELKNWLEEYTMGDLWGKNIIGAQPYSV